MIIADTGFWLALANQKDKHHRKACTFLEQPGVAFITTWPVITETSHLLLNCLGHHALIAFIESYVDGAFGLFSLKEQHKNRLLYLMTKYQDLPMDLADASLVILAEELGHGRILSTDRRDFMTYQWKNHHPFQNLLL